MLRIGHRPRPLAAGYRSEPDPPWLAVARPDSRSTAGGYTVGASPARDDEIRHSSRRLVSLRLHLSLVFVLAAVVPVLAVLALDAAGATASPPQLPIVGDLPVALVVVSAAGFGVLLGLLVTYTLVGPLTVLTRALDALGSDAALTPLPSTGIREVARLAEALAALRTRVVARSAVLHDPDSRVGMPYRIAASLTDMSGSRSAAERRRDDAHYDLLTGLADRVLFLDRLRAAMRRRQRITTHQVAVVLMDVDRFKVINEGLGHALGDDLLVAVARRLERCVRDVDTVARLGGDEWAMLIEDRSAEDEASQVAERVRRALQQPLLVGGHSLFVTVSTGIALLTDAVASPEDLLRDAETAMYRAKELGRDRHVVFDPSLHGRAVARFELESDLRFALERGELEVYYQPIVTADGLTVRGVEALVRWRHPERGLILPADFIGFAEESGLILPLGECVLDRAIEQMHAWQAAGIAPQRLSVNLSARQLRQADLAERVALLLERAGVEPTCLELELTEGVVAEQAEATIEVLKRLRRLGVHLAVDDFGTGYSSLAYLTRFPVSTVKIDRAFLVNIQHDPVNQAIVQAVTTLAHSIEMRVVAEGIETTEQRDLAQALGCDEVQGYLFSKPIPADEVTVWLEEQRSLELRRRAIPAAETH